ncbi:NmrA family transcriptional regulator, partial [Actinomadura adrarensis]
LRNGLYAELLAGVGALYADRAASTGVLTAPLGDGRISVVAREDLADVAVRVARETQDDLLARGGSRHAGRTYELEGVAALGGHDLAEALSLTTGRAIEYRPGAITDARELLEGFGLEQFQVTHTLSIFANAGAGFLDARRTDLTTVLPSTPRDVHGTITKALQP